MGEKRKRAGVMLRTLRANSLSRRGFLVGASVAAAGVGLISVSYKKLSGGGHGGAEEQDFQVDPSLFLRIDRNKTITLLS